MSDRAGTAGRLALAALLVLVAAAVAVRGAALARGERLEARGEERWFAWAQRHPGVAAALEAAAGEVPPGARVVWTVPPGVGEPWVEIMALYRLPAAWPEEVLVREAAGLRADGGSVAGAPPLVVHLHGDGRAVVAAAPAGAGAVEPGGAGE